jgi:hypothetical protein
MGTASTRTCRLQGLLCRAEARVEHRHNQSGKNRNGLPRLLLTGAERLDRSPPGLRSSKIAQQCSYSLSINFVVSKFVNRALSAKYTPSKITRYTVTGSWRLFTKCSAVSGSVLAPPMTPPPIAPLAAKFSTEKLRPLCNIPLIPTMVFEIRKGTSLGFSSDFSYSYNQYFIEGSYETLQEETCTKTLHLVPSVSA